MPRTFPDKKVVETASVPISIKTEVVHDVHLLDGSGSMSGLKFNNAVRGINEDLRASADASKKYGLAGTYSVLQFSTTLNFNRDGNILKRDIDEVAEYRPMFIGEWTALYTSIRDVVEYFVKYKKKDEKVLLKIFTDGHDTQKGIDPNELSKIIQDAEKNHNFTITFVGTKEDVARITRVLAIDATNSLVHDNSAQGITEAFNSTRDASVKYRKSLASGEDVRSNFYAKSISRD